MFWLYFHGATQCNIPVSDPVRLNSAANGQNLSRSAYLRCCLPQWQPVPVCAWLKGEVGDTAEGLVVCLSILKVYPRMDCFNCIWRARLFFVFANLPRCTQMMPRTAEATLACLFRFFCFVFSSVHPSKQDFFGRCRTDLLRTSGTSAMNLEALDRVGWQTLRMLL